MPMYRKKPVVIEAIRFVAEKSKSQILSSGNGHELADWCHGTLSGQIRTGENPTYWIEIETMEGTMRADPGDWIIKEPFSFATRQFYPCKPDIFEATYEEA